MASYTQTERMLQVTTPLGPDVLFLVGLSAVESLSQLFLVELHLIATNDTKVAFHQVLGKKVTAHVKAPGDEMRHFSGICSRLSQGGRDPEFTSYRMDVVPEVWFLSRKAQSRIFQSQSVPEILKKVFQGLKVDYRIQGHYDPRDYCVQYRETDFNFASRLMEEEGIYYYFTHAKDSHTMVVADTPQGHEDVPFGPKVTYSALDDGDVDEDRVTEWEKTQDLRSMKFTLWDHSFELPHKHLESEKTITDSVQVGTETHKLKIGNPDRLEIYDWPGEYAQRFDGVDPNRGDRQSDIQKIFQDNKRTVDIRMQQEAAACLLIEGRSGLRQMTAGHKFTLEKHFNADGAYVLTSVHHTARLSGNYRSGETDTFAYNNIFTCLPASVPFRPQRHTPKPLIQGTQTAVVVGPKNEELYTDKYGRVKVQFHWDREGKNDEKSSCWVRVAQPIAGRRWGGSFWPRIGQEVVVDHLEGDPDRPIIMGTVYNADQMPPYLGQGPDSKHKDDNLISGIKSNTSKGGSGFNEFRFYDLKDKQEIFIHAERDYDLRVKNDAKERIYGNHHHVVGWDKDGKKGGDLRQRIYMNHQVHVHKDQIEHVEGNVQTLVGQGQADNGGNQEIILEKSRHEKIGQDCHITIGNSRHEKVGSVLATQAGQEIHLKAGQKVVIESDLQLMIKGAGGFLLIDASGITIQGTMVKINCGGSPIQGTGASPTAPKPAKPTDPEIAVDAITGQKSN